MQTNKFNIMKKTKSCANDFNESPRYFKFCVLYIINYTVEPRYNEVLGTMKITLLYQVSHIRVKQRRNIKSWDQQNYLVIRGFCYISDLFITRFHCTRKM